MQNPLEQLSNVPLNPESPRGLETVRRFSELVPYDQGIATEIAERASGNVLDQARRVTNIQTAPVLAYMRTAVAPYIPVPGGIGPFVQMFGLDRVVVDMLKGLFEDNRTPWQRFFADPGGWTGWKARVEGLYWAFEREYQAGLVQAGIPRGSDLFNVASRAAVQLWKAGVYDYYRPISRAIFLKRELRIPLLLRGTVRQSGTIPLYSTRIRPEAFRWSEVNRALSSGPARAYRGLLADTYKQLGFATGRQIIFQIGRAGLISTGDQPQENQVIKNAFPYQSQPRVSRVRTKPGEFEFDVIWQGLPSDRVVRIFAQSRGSGGVQNKIFINPWISHGAGAPADRVERRQTIRVSQRNGYAGVMYFATNSTTRAGKIEDEVIGRQVINVPPKSGSADAVQREQSGGGTATPGRNGYEPGFIPKPTGIPGWVIPAAGAAFVASRFMR